MLEIVPKMAPRLTFDSIVILYREYIPFIPMYLANLRGPVEPPLLEQDTPAGWWEEYAAVLFDAATQISSISADMKAADMPLQTPIVGYSVFSAASMHVYLASFPWVDPVSSSKSNAEKLSEQDLDYLRDFADIWPLGKIWVSVLTPHDVSYLHAIGQVLTSQLMCSYGLLDKRKSYIGKLY